MAAPPIIDTRGISSLIHASIGELTVIVAASFTAKVNALETDGQAPIGSSVVKVSVTEPANMSAFEGVYTAIKLFTLLKEPEPSDVQVADDANPPIVAFNEISEFEQTTVSEPAETVAAASI